MRPKNKSPPKRMYKYPAASTINRLKAKGIIMMLWLNGDLS